MVYNIEISDTSVQAQSIINMLKTLIEDELDSRLEYVLQHEEEGKSWEEVERRLLAV